MGTEQKTKRCTARAIPADKVKAIRERHAAGERTCDLAIIFAMNPGTVSRVARGLYGNVSHVTFLDSFWSKVDIRVADECWPWIGARLSKGYGHIGTRGLSQTAHRVMWEISNGIEASDELEVCHKCDNPPCCNPSHLFIGTVADNQRDSREKGRRAHIPPSYGNRRLTFAQVSVIRTIAQLIPPGHRWNKTDRKRAFEIMANHFCVSLHCIRKIYTGEAWNEAEKVTVVPHIRVPAEKF